MSSIVYFGSPRQARLVAEETLPGKLDVILQKLHIRERVKGESVAIKIHMGNNIGYSVVHPVFVRKVVQAVKDGGGKPFVVDVDWDTASSETRGYTTETLGCPIYPAGGPNDRYWYPHERPYKNINTWKVAGMIEDAGFLINFSHAKGHPACGYGGAIKNIALGCMVGETRSAIHDTVHYDPYWFREFCPDEETRNQIISVCPYHAVTEDRQSPGDLHLRVERCNQCGRCLQIAPQGSLKIDAVNFHAFQEACAVSTAVTLSTFDPLKTTHICLSTQITPVCDCFGFTSMPILPDTGIFGSDDIVALDMAVLDSMANLRLLEENLPTSMEVHTRQGHPLQWLHGPLKDPYLAIEYAEKLGLGSRYYELVDVMPVDNIRPEPIGYIPANS